MTGTPAQAAHRVRVHADFAKSGFAYLEWATRDATIPVPTQLTIMAPAATEAEVRAFAATQHVPLHRDRDGAWHAEKTIGCITHRVTAAGGPS